MWANMQNVMNLIRSFGGSGAAPGGCESREARGFHGFINKLNRIPRLAMLMGIVYMFVWAAIDPEHFTQWTTAINSIPENLWILIFLVVSSFAVSKVIRDGRSRPPGGFDSYGSTPTFTPMVTAPDDTRHDDLLDEPPATNPALEEWRRNAPN